MGADEDAGVGNLLKHEASFSRPRPCRSDDPDLNSIDLQELVADLIGEVVVVNGGFRL